VACSAQKDIRNRYSIGREKLEQEETQNKDSKQKFTESQVEVGGALHKKPKEKVVVVASRRMKLAHRETQMN
jgi:hypothetical protein